MRKIELNLDDETARQFDELAQSVGGDPADGLRALLALRRLRSSEITDSGIDAVEASNEVELKRQLAAAERSFRDGTAVDWDDSRKKLGL